jgi:D-3-phosphoglycerate dehydrogenase / 2-oxoglutarate reductase
VRILVVADSYMTDSVFERGLAEVASEHELRLIQLDESASFEPRTPSELRIREYAGDPNSIIPHMPDVDVLVLHGAAVTDRVMDASACLRLICCARGGPVNVDVAAATERGIVVTGTPGKNAEAVADQTIGFIIMLAHQIPRAQRSLLSGSAVGASTFEGAQFLGVELNNRTLGLVGCGHVGRCVARRARALGMTVIVYDPFADLSDETGVEVVTELPDLLGRAEFVSLHARSTVENNDLFDRAAFADMRPGAYFINTARDTLVVEDALDAALASGHIGGAALDVVKPGARKGLHPLLRHENVVLTPHIGGATEEALARGASMLAAEITRFALNEDLIHTVNGVS